MDDYAAANMDTNDYFQTRLTDVVALSTMTFGGASATSPHDESVAGVGTKASGTADAAGGEAAMDDNDMDALGNANENPNEFDFLKLGW